MKRGLVDAPLTDHLATDEEVYKWNEMTGRLARLERDREALLNLQQQSESELKQKQSEWLVCKQKFEQEKRIDEERWSKLFHECADLKEENSKLKEQILELTEELRIEQSRVALHREQLSKLEDSILLVNDKEEEHSSVTSPSNEIDTTKLLTTIRRLELQNSVLLEHERSTLRALTEEASDMKARVQHVDKLEAALLAAEAEAERWKMVAEHSASQGASLVGTDRRVFEMQKLLTERTLQLAQLEEEVGRLQAGLGINTISSHS